MRFSFLWLFVAFLLDLFSLFVFADVFGALWTLAWVVGAILLGLYFIMSAGDTLKSLGDIMVSQRERIEAVKETPWLVLAAIFFMIPGILSDLTALLLLIPETRRWLILSLFKPARTASRSERRTSDTYEAQYEDITHTPTQQQPHRPVLLEGKWEEKSEKDRHPS
jgi:UPF0716 protein FxsA